MQSNPEPPDIRETLVQHLPIMAMLCDAGGLALAVTDELWRAFAIARRPLPAPCRDILPSALVEAAALPARFEAARRDDQVTVLPRVDAVLGGERRSFRLTIAPAPEPQGSTVLYVEELTSLLAFEARVQQADHQTRLTAMASTIAHEIRNPLAGISASVQLVMATLASTDRRRHTLGRVLGEVERLDGLVQDLIDFARPLVATRVPVDLRALAEGVVAGLEPGPRAGTAVKGVGAAEADPALLGRTLSSVIDNAWQAGARRVEVRLDAAGLAVYDDGPGIPEAMVGRLFEPFQTTKTRGTGLGLPNAVRALEAMGGEIAVSPSPLGGAGFAIRLRPLRLPP